MSKLRKKLRETRKEGEEAQERGSTHVQSVTSLQKWKKRFLDTTGEIAWSL